MRALPVVRVCSASGFSGTPFGAVPLQYRLRVSNHEADVIGCANALRASEHGKQHAQRPGFSFGGAVDDLRSDQLTLCEDPLLAALIQRDLAVQAHCNRRRASVKLSKRPAFLVSV